MIRVGGNEYPDPYQATLSKEHSECLGEKERNLVTIKDGEAAYPKLVFKVSPDD